MHVNCQQCSSLIAAPVTSPLAAPQRAADLTRWSPHPDALGEQRVNAWTLKCWAQGFVLIWIFCGVLWQEADYLGVADCRSDKKLFWYLSLDYFLLLSDILKPLKVPRVVLGKKLKLTILRKSKYELRSIDLFHNWVNKLFSEEHKVPRTLFVCICQTLPPLQLQSKKVWNCVVLSEFNSVYSVMKTDLGEKSPLTYFHSWINKLSSKRETTIHLVLPRSCRRDASKSPRFSSKLWCHDHIPLTDSMFAWTHIK